MAIERRGRHADFRIFSPLSYNRKQGSSPILSAAKDAEKEASQIGDKLKSEAKSVENEIKKRV
jgi:hypothetical protein